MSTDSVTGRPPLSVVPQTDCVRILEAPSSHPLANWANCAKKWKSFRIKNTDAKVDTYQSTCRQLTSGCPVQKEDVAIEIRFGLRVEDSRGFGTRRRVRVVAPPVPPPPKRDVDRRGGSGGGSVEGSCGVWLKSGREF